jgi:hypothetical protein
MDEELKQRLGGIFAANAEKQMRAKEVREKVISAQDQFLLDFAVLAEEIVRPALVEIGEFARAKGLPYRIEAAKGSAGTRSRDISPSMGIRFIQGDPDRYRSDHEYAGWSATADKHAMKVRLHHSTMTPGRGGMSGPAGERSLDGVTYDFVQAEVAKVLASILA